MLTTLITTWITSLYASTGLAGILLAMAIESCCIPLPSEIIMPLAGIIIAGLYTTNPTHLLGTNPAFPFWVNLLLVALAGAVGCLIGSMVAYGIGYAGGRPLMLRYGRYVLISQHDADKADSFFLRWGSATAFFSRLLPVVRTYISLPAGIAKMPFGKFCLYTFLGSLPWCFLLAYVGYTLGNHLDTLGPIFHSLDIVILVLVVLLVVLYVWRHIRNDRKARAALAQLEAAPPIGVQPQSQQWQPQGQGQQSWSQPSQSQFQGQGQQQWSQPQQQPPFSPQPQQNRSQAQPPQQFPSQQGWNQQQQGQGAAGWGQPPQSQPPAPTQMPQQAFPSQQGGGQPVPPQQPWPPQAGSDDRSVRRG